MSKVDEIKDFLSADQAEMERRYKERMGYDESEMQEEVEEAPSVDEVEQELAEKENITNEVIDQHWSENGYSYTEETAHKVKVEVIDKTPRQDEEVFKLPKPKTMSEIEGDIEVEDKERGIVFTSFYNKKERYHFNRLYDVSGEKPLLLASGSLDYKDGMFIIHYPNKQPCDDRGDYLKYMQSALYKLDKSNKPHFVAANAIEILNNGWFEQSSGKDYSVYLCKDENAGKYRRVMNFGADMSGHLEVTADGTIIDELDRTDWYHKDVYKYDAEKHTLKFVKGEGYERDEDDYDIEHGYDEDAGYAEVSWITQTSVIKTRPDIQVSPDVKIQILESEEYNRDMGMSIYVYDAHDDVKYSQYESSNYVCSISSNDTREFEKDFDYTLKDGVLTIKDFSNGKNIIIDGSRNEDGQLSVNEQPMDINELKKGFKHLGWDFEDSKYGILLHHPGYKGATFIKNDGTKNTDLRGRYYDRVYVGEMLPNGLATVETDSYYLDAWGVEDKNIYDFKNSCYRDDLEEIRDLGDKFYAAKKTGEKQFGVYEMADEEMKNPLIMVDGCERNNESGWMINFENIPDNIIYTIGETKYRCEITPEGKLKPIAKQTSEKDLFLSTGSQWIKANLKEGTEWNIDIKERPFIRISKKVYYGDGNHDYEWKRKVLSNANAEKLAHSIARTAQTEKFEKLKEGYHNAKKRLQDHRDDKTQKAMTDDIKSGIAKTKERDYVHVTETDRSAER